MTSVPMRIAPPWGKGQGRRELGNASYAQPAWQSCPPMAPPSPPALQDILSWVRPFSGLRSGAGPRDLKENITGSKGGIINQLRG